MDKAMYDKGLGVRRAVLGDEYVDAAMKNVDDFNQPLQDILNEFCWGAIWGREGLPRKTRSMINLAMISILTLKETFGRELDYVEEEGPSVATGAS